MLCERRDESQSRCIIIINKQNWIQFLLVVKVTALKQQISKFYPQIQLAITVSQRPVINVKASLCACSLRAKIFEICSFRAMPNDVIGNALSNQWAFTCWKLTFSSSAFKTFIS